MIVNHSTDKILNNRQVFDFDCKFIKFWFCITVESTVKLLLLHNDDVRNSVVQLSRYYHKTYFKCEQ